MTQTAATPSIKPTREELVAALNAADSIEAVADVYGVSRMTVYRWRRDYRIAVIKAPKAA